MGLIDDLLKIPHDTQRGANHCKVRRILAALAEDEATQLKDLISNPAVAHTDLARVLSANSYPISEHTIRRHRANICACEPE